MIQLFWPTLYIQDANNVPLILLLKIVCFIRSQTGCIPTYYAKSWSFAAENLQLNLPNFVKIH